LEDPNNPRVTAWQEEDVRRPSAAPWLALAVVVVIGAILLLLFTNRNDQSVSTVESTSQVLGTHVTPTTMTVESSTTEQTMASPGQPPRSLQSGPVVERTVQVPGPTQVVKVPGPVRTVAVPGPAETVNVPGPTKTVSVPGPTKTVEAPAPSDNGASSTDNGSSSSDNGAVALGTQARGTGTIQSVSDDGMSVTIDHEAMGSAHLQNGTDSFKLQDPSLAADFQPGQKVNFLLQKTEDGWQVVGLTQIAQ
jgi:Cu/Ag efflux protein CusF